MQENTHWRDILLLYHVLTVNSSRFRVKDFVKLALLAHNAILLA